MARSQEASVSSHADLASHEKLIELCDMLGVRRPEAVGLVHLLWHYCAKKASDGVILCSRLVLAEEMYWTGDADDLYRALVTCLWIDEGLDGTPHCHEWELYGGPIAQKAKKREYDRRRLQQLRLQEEEALEPPKTRSISGAFGWDGKTPEVIKIHAILMGDTTPALPNDLRRISQTLSDYPRMRAVEVALNYVAWQIDVSRQYREHQQGETPHKDQIRGWQNQMRYHQKNGWSLRDQKTTSQKRVVEINEDDLRRYHTSNEALRTA